MKTFVLLCLTLFPTIAADTTPPLTAPFIKTTEDLIGAGSAMALVAAWGDYDNDGWPDLFLSNAGGGTDWIYHNNKNGTLTKTTLRPITSDASANTWGAAWVDYDNDGWVDLLVSSQDGRAANRLYHNKGGTFERVTEEQAGEIAGDIPQAQGISWADYDNDGRLDLFVANGKLGVGYQDFLYHNQGAGKFARVYDSLLEQPVVNSPLGSWSDYDNDGDMDLLVTHTGGVANSFYRNDGKGRFVDVTAESGLADDIGESVGAAWGDYDNDGDLDLFITNVRLTGRIIKNFFYRNNGNGTFTRITEGLIAQEENHFVSGVWVDYDNDGWLDMFVTVTGQDGQTTRNRLYHNQGDGTFAKVTEGTMIKETGYFGASAWADYDNNGFPDVFISMGTIFGAQNSVIYRNSGNANNWIKVKCVGTISNRSAIGAKIRVKARINGIDRWQMRQIVGSEGWITFNSLESIIGLGNATNIDVLRIEWPSGLVQEFHDVKPKQSLTIVEQSSLKIEKRNAAGFDLQIHGPAQQRYQIESSPDLKTWSTLGSVTITNADLTATFNPSFSAEAANFFFRVAAE